MIRLSDELKSDSNKLIESYNEALKDERFKNFVSKLKISDEVLMKYTSILNDSKEEYYNCLDCKGLCDCKNKMIGYAYLPKIVNGLLQFNYKKCHYKVKQDKQYSYQNNIKYYNVTKENKLADFSKIDKRMTGRQEAIIWLNNFLNNYPNCKKGLYLNGNTGCGKTYLVIAMINELAKKNVKCAVAFWPEFLRELKSSFDTDYEEKIQYLMDVPILLINDLGGESSTSWARDEILFPILQARLDDKDKFTFITSNCSKDILYEHLSLTKQGVEEIKAERIISRINSLTEEITMLSKDFRSK